MERLSRGLCRAVKVHRRSRWAQRPWLERAAVPGAGAACRVRAGASRPGVGGGGSERGGGETAEPGLEEGLWARLGGSDISLVAWHSFDRVSCCPAKEGPEDQT